MPLYEIVAQTQQSISISHVELSGRVLPGVEIAFASERWIVDTVEPARLGWPRRIVCSPLAKGGEARLDD